MLLAGESVSGEVRQALRENRREDAAKLLMRDYRLTCEEASDLLDVPVC